MEDCSFTDGVCLYVHAGTSVEEIYHLCTHPLSRGLYGKKKINLDYRIMVLYQKI